MYEAIDRYVQGLIERSTPERTAWNVERIRAGKPVNWNYIDGCMITALLSMADITGDARYSDFSRRFIDSFVDGEGNIRTFEPDKHSLDDVNEGRVLFPLYELTGEEKYKKAARRLHEALTRQPRTREGSFWHKGIYPNQVWLDGVYMAQPFAALYERELGDGDYSDIVKQISIVRDRMRDEQTGLYYHGYDESRSVFWADPVTGLSRSFWLRSIGWFAVALADLCGIIPDAAARSVIEAVFKDLMASVRRYADGDSGMYYQVVDQGDRPGNYLESSGSSMMAYAMMKGARLGVLAPEYAGLGKKTFDGIVSRHLSFEGEELRLGGICLVAGLGPADNTRRDGTFEYYISEPVVENDAKGVAPLVLAYTEVRRLPA